MMSIWTVWIVIGAFWILLVALPFMRWSRCNCGREKLPYFSKRHEKQWVMWSWVFWVGTIAGWGAVFGSFLIALLNGLLAVWSAKCAWEHGKGKRKWPAKVLGRVKINRHGRLIVVKS